MSQLERLGNLESQDLGYLSTTAGLYEAGFFRPPSEDASIEPRVLKSGLEKTLKRRISMTTLRLSQLNMSDDSPEPQSPIADFKYGKGIFQDDKTYSPSHRSKYRLRSCLGTSQARGAAHGYRGHGARRHVSFNKKCKLIETWNEEEYDRVNPDMRRISVMVTYYPRELIPIRKEINEAKREMEIHPDSIANTHYLKV